jgi:hypothetical protein
MASRDERAARAHFEERYSIRGNSAAALLARRILRDLAARLRHTDSQLAEAAST